MTYHDKIQLTLVIIVPDQAARASFQSRGPLDGVHAPP
jgi:hypothetical protein